MSYIFNNKIQYQNTSQVDALDRLRTSNLTAIFDPTVRNNI